MLHDFLRFHLPAFRIPDRACSHGFPKVCSIFSDLPGISSSKRLRKILLASWYAQKFGVGTVAHPRRSLRAASSSLHPEMPCWSLGTLGDGQTTHGKYGKITGNNMIFPISSRDCHQLAILNGFIYHPDISRSCFDPRQMVILERLVYVLAGNLWPGMRLL